ncbi:hypothetical protein SDRG_15565 [Saprolegnia diclina VS20]|uniref:Uncharacterized protein n=1 Tax=Saprolegnia diclina (strain VS20) TaxID=1156394 RepID=T0PZU6_SAPDV|nr:hypothetical protein SDRG_15565 [Saprolegnia diclina VS20]EQC26625.1 hypothetical protein SDRG_15565 [Saprolegnia diclina VS20]|eukprot:XP_008619963.1 hypothetical protein SDRG_15565 [Saprolegnia diclina VS20]
MAMDGLRKSASSRNLSQLAQQLRGLEPTTPAKPQVQRPPRHTNVPTYLQCTKPLGPLPVKPLTLGDCSREIAHLTHSLRVRA